MQTMTANQPVRTGLWSRFSRWAYRVIERLPAQFEGVDPAVTRVILPF